MIQKIQEVYGSIMTEFLRNPTMNTPELRSGILERLCRELPGAGVKCDEENNPPEIIDQNVLVARISWIQDGGLMHTNLYFGDYESIRNLKK